MEEVYNLDDKKNRRRPNRTVPDWWKETPPEKKKTGPPKKRKVRQPKKEKPKARLKPGPKKGSPKVPGSGRKASGIVTTVLSVRIEEELVKRLDAEAARRGLSRNALICEFAKGLPEWRG